MLYTAQSDLILSSLLFHAKYIEMNLSAEQEIAQQWVLHEIYPNILPLTIQFQAYGSLYPKLFQEVIRINVKPATWWLVFAEKYLDLKSVTCVTHLQV